METRRALWNIPYACAFPPICMYVYLAVEQNKIYTSLESDIKELMPTSFSTCRSSLQTVNHTPNSTLAPTCTCTRTT